VVEEIGLKERKVCVSKERSYVGEVLLRANDFLLGFGRGRRKDVSK
jgi:hypothetical protein